MSDLAGRERRMIRFLTARTRIGLVVAAMAVAVPMVTFAQTTEPASEIVPASDQPAVPNSSLTGDENSTDTDTSVKTVPLAKSSIPAAVENELRRELLDDRAAYIDRWLSVIAIVLTFFSIVAVVLGYIGFKRFREIETEAKSSTETSKEHAAVAKKMVDEIKEKRDEGERIIQNLNAQIAADHPEEAKQVVANVRENPRASLIDKAIADAVSLQQQGKREDAIEKWRALAHIAEGSDNDLATRAWFSSGYLALDEDLKGSVLANDRAIRLNPDLAEAYINRSAAKQKLGQNEDAIADCNEAIRLKPDLDGAYINRGNAKQELEQYEAAIADYDEAIRLKPALVEAYSNRGVAKARLGQYEAAIADYDEAIRLKPDHVEAYINRGVAKHKSGRHEDAIADYDEAIRLKPDHVEAYINRGNAKQELEQYEDAIDDYDEAIRLNPALVEAYSNRGVAKAELGIGKYEAAIADYDEAIRLNPALVEAYSNRGVTKAELGQYEAAIATMTKRSA